jgi:hypothetical protein
MLLAGINASLHFDFNDYLHSASLCAAPRRGATVRIAQSRSLSLSGRKLSHLFRDYRVSVSGNSLRAHTLATGNWQLATGNWQLATGNWQLATDTGN